LASSPIARQKQSAGGTPALPGAVESATPDFSRGFQPTGHRCPTPPRRVATVECHPNNTGDPPAHFGLLYAAQAKHARAEPKACGRDARAPSPVASATPDFSRGFQPTGHRRPTPPVAWRRLNVTPTTQVTRLHILACCTTHRRNMPRPNRKHAGGTPALPGFQVFPLIRAYSRLAWLRAMSDNRRSLARLASRSARAAGSAMRLALRSASRSRSSLGMSSG